MAVSQCLKPLGCLRTLALTACGYEILRTSRRVPQRTCLPTLHINRHDRHHVAVYARAKQLCASIRSMDIETAFLTSKSARSHAPKSTISFRIPPSNKSSSCISSAKTIFHVEEYCKIVVAAHEHSHAVAVQDILSNSDWRLLLPSKAFQHFHLPALIVTPSGTLTLPGSSIGA